MHRDDRHELKDDFAGEIFAQVQRPIDDDEDELEQQHDEERGGDFVFFDVGGHAAVALGRLERDKSNKDYTNI